eukprot:gnl/MRDRNA2_/MRDRNA2_120994_c0_seq1.p1 gnl/MRDRNA2_/MRDRNA2_120994_c0~~gnl/MRDRNA2_/MRDRNA2_120994_c0_seq1.p1  ORF type:complete len:742 (-),score=160.61 gnl/MRDRNA2_/MRDRNA2_120994_c0_seq1:216-2441(-)
MSGAKRGRGGSATGAPVTPSASRTGTGDATPVAAGDSGLNRKKADGPTKDGPDKSSNGIAGGGGWGKQAGGLRTGGANGVLPKAKAMSSHMGSLARVPHNVAALAARNLGGFVPNKIFVGGVPITCTDDQFTSYFEPYGSISKIELHALRGFGYVTYENVESVDAVLEQYGEHYLSKKWVEVKRSIPRELIDSYEKEQRRLLAEMGAEAEFNEPSTHKSHSHGGSGGASNSKGDGSGTNAASSSGASGKPRTESRVSGSSAGGDADGGGSAWGLPPAGDKSTPSPKWGAGNPTGEPSGTVAMNRIQQLKEMGFSEAVARRVLGECVWDVNKAIDRLLLEGVPEDLEEDEPADDPALDPLPGQAAPPKGEAPPPPSDPLPGAEPGPPPASAWGRPKPASTSPADGTPASGSSAGPTAGQQDSGLPGLPAATTPPWGARAGPPSPQRNAQTSQPGGLPAAAVQKSPKHSAGETARLPKSPSQRTGQSPVVEPAPETPQQNVVQAEQQPSPQPVPPAQAEPPLKAESAAKTQTKQEPKKQTQPDPTEASADTEAKGGGYPSTSGVPVAARTRPATEVKKPEVPGPVEEVTPAPPTDKVPQPEADASLPQKEIRRVLRNWPAEDVTQLNVEEGEFVDVWVDSQTAHGWIHAERTPPSGADGGPFVGWLPAFVLETPTEDKKWMRIIQKWNSTDESQCDVEEGVVAQVWLDTRTNEGWTYVEVPSADGSMKPGWLPEFCLDWKKER